MGLSHPGSHRGCPQVLPIPPVLLLPPRPNKTPELLQKALLQWERLRWAKMQLGRG